ncbi:MAG TPA: NAD(P)-dependent oxidoreductase [Candidatus Omnitrophota bacterium]|nr:NAD(P)-dependent oxidoreductase [Candidatus Omnitrophota bacterium]
MHIVITGGSGFLGSNLIEFLKEKTDFHITIIDTHKSSLHGCSFIKTDLSWPHTIDKTFKQVSKMRYGKIVLVHLAGIADKNACERDPVRAFSLNVTLLIDATRAAEKYGFRKIIFPSSAAVYAAGNRKILKENDPVYPSSVYAATKIAAENYLHNFCLSSRIECIVARFSNIYGATSNENTLLGTILKQINNQLKNITLQGSNDRKDYIYIKDAVEFLHKAIRYKQNSALEIFNVCSGKSYPALEVAQQVCKYTHPSMPIVMKNKKLRQSLNMELSFNKARKHLSWIPRYTLDAGINDSLKELGIV